ncbi:MAG: hypothetical protein ACK5Q5_24190 [Planctomycetaceae bacterium]
MQTVAVGTTTTYAYVDPISGATTALNPTPDTTIRSAAAPVPTPSNSSPTSPPTANSTDDLFQVKPLSYPRPQSEQAPSSDYFDARNQQTSPVEVARPVASQDGWKPARTATPVEAPVIAIEPRRDASDYEVVVASRK